MAPKHRALLLMLIVANIIASALHFGDNMFRFNQYPEPMWIASPHTVAALWLLMTPLLILGWWAASRGRQWTALATFWLYGVLSLFALGHYFYASPFQLSAQINLLIGLEAVAAALLIAAAPFVVGLRTKA
jgi:hypothetical protein